MDRQAVSQRRASLQFPASRPLNAAGDRKRYSMNSKLLLAGFVLLLAGLYASGCGPVQIPTDIAIPSALPPIAGTIIANPPQATAAPANTEAVAPGTEDGSSGENLLLYAMLALFVVFTLFGVFILLGRPGRTPGPEE